MKLSRVPLLALVATIPAMALRFPQEPIPAPPAQTFYASDPVKVVCEMVKLDIAGVVKVDGLRYRTCPRTDCTAMGQYAKGTPITIKCYAVKNTTVVNGDPGWALLDNGYWVALSHGEYVAWSGGIPECPE